ncbi:MAG: DUF5337 domain-containing protein [Tateyamaria sp.]|jgi:membrane protease YdiL (CAAX protease family)|nr:DUF5337 domain-containing protein [Tateyamaria sp.]
MLSREYNGPMKKRLALVIALIAVLWVFANIIGVYLGLPNRLSALFDLAALAGFGSTFWIAIKIWRHRQKDKD